MNEHPATLKPYVVGEVRILSLLKEAVTKPFSVAYLETIGGWLFMVIALYLLKPYISGQFLGFYGFFLDTFETFIAPSAIAVSWYRYLGYGEKIPFLRFKQKEASYALMWALFLICLLIVVLILCLIGVVGSLAPLKIYNLKTLQHFVENKNPEFFIPLIIYAMIYLGIVISCCFYVIYRIAIWLALDVLDLPGSLVGPVMAPFKLEFIVLFSIYLFVFAILERLIPSGGAVRTIIKETFSFFIFGIDVSFIFLLIKARVDFSVPSESKI